MQAEKRNNCKQLQKTISIMTTLMLNGHSEREREEEGRVGTAGGAEK